MKWGELIESVYVGLAGFLLILVTLTQHSRLPLTVDLIMAGTSVSLVIASAARRAELTTMLATLGLLITAVVVAFW